MFSMNGSAWVRFCRCCMRFAGVQANLRKCYKHCENVLGLSVLLQLTCPAHVLLRQLQCNILTGSHGPNVKQQSIAVTKFLLAGAAGLQPLQQFSMCCCKRSRWGMFTCLQSLLHLLLLESKLQQGVIDVSQLIKAWGRLSDAALLGKALCLCSLQQRYS